jgi:hypothetical protein
MKNNARAFLAHTSFARPSTSQSLEHLLWCLNWKETSRKWMARFSVSYNQRASGQLKPEECFIEQTMHAFRAQAVFVRALSDSNKRMLRLDGDI